MYYYYAYIENGICIDIERTRTIKTELTNYVEVTENEYNAYMDEDTTSEYYIIGMSWNGSEWVVSALFYYAVLNEKDIATRVVANKTEINRVNFIPITEEEYTSKSCINRQWDADSEQFVTVPLSVYADADTTKVSVNGSEVPLQTLLDAMQTQIASKGGQVTATDILVALTTVDGAGSGVDSDTLDGRDSSYFARNDDVQAMMIEMDTKANASDLESVATKTDLETLKTELLAAIASGTGSVIKSIQKGVVYCNDYDIYVDISEINPNKSIVLLNGTITTDVDEYQYGSEAVIRELTSTRLSLRIATWLSDDLMKGQQISYQIIEFN